MDEMKQNEALQNQWGVFQWYCPNCGALVRGYRSEDGYIKVECGRCHAYMLRIRQSRRCNLIRIYAPKRQQDRFA